MSGGEIQIGRAVDCAIRTDDGMVSRHHARLFWAGGQYYLEDLGSANGVYYQEQRVTRHMLKHGDAVRCGSLWLRFVDPDGAGSGPVSAQGQAAAYQPPPVVQPHQPHAVGPTPHTGPHQASPEPIEAAPSQPAQPRADAEVVARLERRIEQLETELRLYRRGRGEEIAKRIEELDERNAALRQERDELKQKVNDLESTLESQGTDAVAQRAGALVAKTAELVQQLNDTLSNLRINVMAAEGEFEQFAHEIPRASFELIRESLRTSSSDVDMARDLLRNLRDLAN